MAWPAAQLLPHIRRVVTAHDARGIAVARDVLVPSENMDLVPGAREATIWVTDDGLPTAENNASDDGAQRRIDNPENFDLVPHNGTNLRSTELAPGAMTAMHRTSSLDYNILVSGELILITEDGAETYLHTPGDTVVQRGTLHAWRNPSATAYTRWISILMPAEPAVVNGERLGPLFIETPIKVDAGPAMSVEGQQMPSEVGA
ncbi:hypothetical protein BDN70DRAFT_996014 [Pholiota conissans]|uniref:Uncharacterized protein n=1 Tax=Pholiota conissans TaxID=109636 RepID=A0A9P6CXU9_9AGAR|nr:hypothetical protein BDN70DRAFT_996014 [Pholiota conissans]